MWIDRYFQSLSNVEKAFLPLNKITENIKFVGADNVNQRMFISARIKNPVVWKVSKLETTRPVGILQLTFTQSEINQHTDYIERDENNEIVGMWADYYDYEVEPVEEKESGMNYKLICKIVASTSIIKVGGSYKLLTLKVIDDSDGLQTDITSKYSNYTSTWTCNIDDMDMTENVTWLAQNDFNKMKIKFPDNREYLNKVLTVNCEIKNSQNQSLTASAKFELSI